MTLVFGFAQIKKRNFVIRIPWDWFFRLITLPRFTVEGEGWGH